MTLFIASIFHCFTRNIWSMSQNPPPPQVPNRESLWPFDFIVLDIFLAFVAACSLCKARIHKYVFLAPRLPLNKSPKALLIAGGYTSNRPQRLAEVDPGISRSITGVECLNVNVHRSNQNDFRVDCVIYSFVFQSVLYWHGVEMFSFQKEKEYESMKE